MENIMTYTMKFYFFDPVVDNSLRNIWLDGKKIGYSVDIAINYYRGHFLSVIDVLELYIDGNRVDDELIRFEINGKSFGLCDLKECYKEFWNVRDDATLSVYCPGGLAEGEHEVKLVMYIRSPYMATGPDHQYMPVDFSGTKTLTIKD